MQFWIIADTHFGHTILQDYCNRPADADKRILKGLSKGGLTTGDVLIHLGDVCIGNDRMWHEQLMSSVSAKTILVRGNHDKRSIKWYLGVGWSMVVDRFDIKIYGRKIAFSHFPLVDDGSFDINIHGHFHNSSPDAWEPELKDRISDKHKLICIEHHHRPVTLKSIVESKHILSISRETQRLGCRGRGKGA